MGPDATSEVGSSRTRKNMKELIEQTPAIIQAAAQSTLGVLSLLVLTAGLLGSVFFRNASESARIRIYGLILLGVAMFSYVAIRTSHVPWQIQVAKAQYGIGERQCNATAWIADFVARNCRLQTRCAVPITNEMCGDPANGTPKAVRIDYLCGETTKTISEPEDGTAMLSCP